MGKKFIMGDFKFEETKDSIKCRDLFSNHVIRIIPKKRGGKK